MNQELLSWDHEELTALELARDRGRGVTERLERHGTSAGYFRHRTRGEPACQQCRDACARKARERRRTKAGPPS